MSVVVQVHEDDDSMTISFDASELNERGIKQAVFGALHEVRRQWSQEDDPLRILDARNVTAQLDPNTRHVVATCPVRRVRIEFAPGSGGEPTCSVRGADDELAGTLKRAAEDALRHSSSKKALASSSDETSANGLRGV